MFTYARTEAKTASDNFTVYRSGLGIHCTPHKYRTAGVWLRARGNESARVRDDLMIHRDGIESHIVFAILNWFFKNTEIYCGVAQRDFPTDSTVNVNILSTFFFVVLARNFIV